MNAAYQTLIVKFSEPIKVLDGIFDDAAAMKGFKSWLKQNPRQR